ncbi:MAG: alpha-L-arabinofuranosidase C-terminal domain-containing protein [Ferruginibacter sp.]
MNIKKTLAVLLLVIISGLHGKAQNNLPLVVKASQVKAAIKPTMWGVFFEDINLGADGGIYAELIKNRSFEFTKPLMGWKVLGKPKTEGDFLVINRNDENTNNPRFLRVTLHQSAARTIGLSNEGFRGMGIKKGLRYDFSAIIRKKNGETKLLLELVNSKDAVIGSTVVTVPATNGEWKKITASFNATDTAMKAKLNIWMEGDGELDADMISLFPSDTWKGRPGGMRADMVQLLADMKPGFIRFPGGCIVEGFDLARRYQWKKTIGPIEERQLIINRWNTEFANRQAPDYFQTFGLGFFEYFQLAEDIGAAPLPILNCGMACQFNSAEVVPLNQLDPYIQDALDLIEFANGDINTQWGKVRAAMGHPQPFNLKMMGVGNENWGPQYMERLQLFFKAIKAKYPGFKIVSSSGTDPEGGRFDYLNGELRKMNTDFIDEHYYRNPEWFLQNAARYDSYDRKGPKIFAGEYAAHVNWDTTALRRNSWRAAIAEAAFMTGLERNADVVEMASYAPLFAHAEGWQWAPDLIWVNNLRSYGTPNYQVQKLFSLNKGTHVVPLEENGIALTGKDSLYASACIDQNSGELILKLVNTSGSIVSKAVIAEGVKKLVSAKLLEISGELDTVNSFDQPGSVIPVETLVPVKGKKINLLLKPYSFTIVRIKI